MKSRHLVDHIALKCPLAVAGLDGDKETPGGELEMTNPARLWYRLESLVPRRHYRVSIWAQTRVGAGEVFSLEDVTLADGRMCWNGRGEGYVQIVSMLKHF